MTKLAQLNKSKVFSILFASMVAMILMWYTPPAEAAFSKITVNGKSVTATTTDNGLFQDMNLLLTTVLFVAGFVVVVSIIYAGVMLSTAQGSPQRRTQGFIGLGMSFLGGWVVYKCLTIAGWISGFGGS